MINVHHLVSPTWAWKLFKELEDDIHNQSNIESADEYMNSKYKDENNE